MKLTTNCETCNAVKVLHCEYVTDNVTNTSRRIYKTYKCGHTEITDIDLIQHRKNEARYASLDGHKSAYLYQREGIDKVLDNFESNESTLIADGMGLGKTIQFLVSLRNAGSDKLPCLIVVKSSTVFQWIRETMEWCFNDPLAVFPILGTQGFIPPGFKCYIISMDTLGRNGTWKKLLPLKLKSICVDECHSFKDSGSKRTISLLELIKTADIQYKVLLSGTPIKNRASEYFVALNLLAPDYFPSLDSFKKRWLLPESRGPLTVYNRLSPYRLDQFKDLTSKWIIRREKKEVYGDLPELTRNFQYVPVENEVVKKLYNQQLDIMEAKRANGEMNDSFSILAEIARLRHIVGMAKTQYIADIVDEFLEMTDDKIAIGIHHKDVRDDLAVRLFKHNPLKLSGEDSSWQKDQIVKTFGNDPTKRVLVINQLAGGTGLDGIQEACSNLIIAEREWNAADEEQFESRVDRPRKNGTKIPATADYIVVLGTIDEWFDALVKEKRAIFGETVTNWKLTEDFNSLRDLVEKTLSNRLR